MTTIDARPSGIAPPAVPSGRNDDRAPAQTERRLA